MLKKKDIALFILHIFRKTPVINKILYTLSRMYIDEYRFFSYDPAVNGEQKIIQKLPQTFTNKLVFFDTGANVGDWTEYTMSCFDNYEGHLFEMSKQTYQTLKNRHGKNKNLTINNLALSDKNETIEYKNYGANDGGNTMLSGADYHKKTYKVEKGTAITGDSYCAEHSINHINFLKIDTEGSEYFVLKGFHDSIKAQKIDIIQFEYGYTHGDAKTLMRDFYTFLEQYGYIIGRLSANGVAFKQFSYTDNDFKSGPNYIACLPQFKTALENF